MTTCTAPSGIANGHQVNFPSSYVNGTIAQYGCNALYSMAGGSTLTCITGTGVPNPGWQGASPICTLEFLESAWFWLLIGILGLLTLLGLLGCLTWLCIRYCCNGCMSKRRRGKVRDVEDVEDEESQCSRLCCGCCFYCMRKPDNAKDTKDGCCDYFGCCGYVGCCACCCWCCRCCREIIEPERTVRVRQGGKQKHRPIFSLKRQRSTKSKNKKKKMAMLKLGSQRQFVKSNTLSSTQLPTTQMVRSLIQDDPTLFRKVAKTLPVWMPHTHSIRDINTSTK